MATGESIQSLIDDGLISGEDGSPTKKHQIQLSLDMPVIDTAQFAWSNMGKIFFDNLLQEIKTLKLLGEWWLCNITYDLEPEAFSISPKLLPIGPLIPNDQNATSF
ncbi:hypothetical protein L6164_006731 [Bauhinia variegata]|uniref:Uncharacterized protein n=1 Tax=Bauhinia variegata TaxID=167791 RepID=A0ACB9PVB5_BAUVA|nr:hypothetical protein L6164_006731 [Bauhinia variegata]